MGGSKNKKQHVTPKESLVSMSTIPEEEVEGICGEGLVKPNDKRDWENNDSDEGEYRDSIQVISGGLEGLRVSGRHGGLGGLEPNTGAGYLFINTTLRRSGRVSRSRE